MKILLIVYDNESYVHWFPQGIAYIAAVLRQEGHEVTIYSQDVHHYPDNHLTEYLDANRFNVVGYSTIGGYYQYQKLLKVAEAIKRSKNLPLFVLGGHGPTPEPEYFFKKTGADVIVMGEGEMTIIELLDAYSSQKSFHSVNGIAFVDNENEVIVNSRRDLIRDIDSILWPAYDLFPIEHYRLLRMPNCERTDFVMPILSGRGCPFSCNFCYRMDKGFRPRSNESVIEEIKFLKAKYNITYIVFSDELLMSSKNRTISLCEDLIRADINIKWACNGRLNFAVPEVLRIMKRAGCVFINYGIEAFDDRILKNMSKHLTTDQIVKGVEATLDNSISPGINIIFGNIGENESTLQKGVEFLLKYDDGADLRTIRPVTPYPGSPLYYYAIEKGLLKDCEDFYESKHNNSDLLSVNFTTLSDEEFYSTLSKANQTLIENYMRKKLDLLLRQTTDIYVKKDASFRGFRAV